MKKKFERTDFVSWLGPDASQFWATSYTVDEHQAFALVYRVLGGRVLPSGVHLRFQRSGFRRAGQGVAPRRWLHPFSVPTETPLPSYHPKVMLAGSADGHALVVSTGNLADDDMYRTRNVAVRIDVPASIAKRISGWIERPPKGHRALCLVVDGNGVRLNDPKRNASSLRQFVELLERCPACRKARRRTGSWVVAAPFWSPNALTKMAVLEPDGSIEAYFRARSLWDQVGMRAQADSTHVRLDRVHAYELRRDGELPRWHHKIVGWRCCAGRSARAALYLGSANATVCGFFGKRDRAVNWEAGVIWRGRAAVWEQARALARAEYAAVKLGHPRGAVDPDIASDDDLGITDTDEIERLFAAHVERRVRVYRQLRSIGRTGGSDLVRVLGHTWRLHTLRVRFEDKSAIKDAGVLAPGKRIRIPEGTRPQVHAVFKLELPAGKTSDSDVPPYAETTLDLVDLDPEPQLPPPTRRSAIAAALAGLWRADWGPGRGNGSLIVSEGAPVRDDVRFPFAEVFGLGGRRPHAADAWLERISRNSEKALDPLPKFWARLAAAMQEEDLW